MPRDIPAAPTTPPIERLADDVRRGFPKSEYARGFNDGIDALIARLAEARSTPAEALDVERLLEDIAYRIRSGAYLTYHAGPDNLVRDALDAEYTRLRSPESDR
jgi:hypothetical protein